MADKNVIKIKTNFIDGLNKVNKLLTGNTFDEESFKFILEKYKFTKSFLIKKLYSYMYNYPWIITYFNKYMNYLGIVSSDINDFIKSYRYILLSNGVLDSRRFCYIKMSAGKDDLQSKIIDLFDKYFFEQFDMKFNYKELLFYYNLYLNGIITNQDIYEIDLLLNNNSKTINLPDFSPEESKEKPISIDKIIKQYRDSSRGVDFINNEIHKRKVKLCSNCQYYGREVVPFDGNAKDINDIDVLIINLFPDLNDLKEKRTFRERTIVRENISLFPKDIKWLLVNLTPCAFKSKSELGKDVDEISDHLNGCNKIVLDFIKTNINPRFVVLIGQEAASAFIPIDDFANSLGNLIDDKYISVLHPNSMKQIKTQARGKKYWENVQNLLKNYVKSKTTAAVPSKPAAGSEESKLVQTEQQTVVIEKPSNKINNKYLLLDVKEIEDGNSVLLIFTDENGNKHYEKKRNVTTGYIKDSTFKDCSILSDSVDIEFSMTKMEKFKLIKLLREKMAKLKG